MGAVFTPKIGTRKADICRHCVHDYCIWWRARTQHACRLCGQPIGGATRVYEDDATPTHYVHADCLEDESDRERS